MKIIHAAAIFGIISATPAAAQVPNAEGESLTLPYGNSSIGHFREQDGSQTRYGTVDTGSGLSIYNDSAGRSCQTISLPGGGSVTRC